MNNLLTPPPEHDLRSSTHNRQRDELIAIVAHESHQSTPRRRFVPLAAAAAVVAVVAGLAVGVPALRDDGSEPAVSGSTGSDSASRAPAQELDALATKLTWSACLMGVREDPRLPDTTLPYTGGKAFEYKQETAPGTPKRWFFTAAGSYGSSLVCALDAQGKVVERWSMTGPSGLGGFLFAPADLRGNSSGLYTAPVARITVQKSGGPLVEARLREGFWFTPLADAKAGTVRAYDQAGKLIYDSAKDGPWANDCYANPAGTKVVKQGKKPNPSPASCTKTLVWSHQPR